MTAISCIEPTNISTVLQNRDEEWPTIDTIDQYEEYKEPVLPKSGKITSVYEVECDGKDWIVQTIPRLEKIALLPTNWDDEGSSSTSHDIVKAAFLLLQRLWGNVTNNISVPVICPIAGGGFQLEWTSEHKYLELEFLDEKTILFLKEETGVVDDQMRSGEYDVNDIEKTYMLLDWLATD